MPPLREYRQSRPILLSALSRGFSYPTEGEACGGRHGYRFALPTNGPPAAAR
jgi:hypothetical protein